MTEGMSQGTMILVAIIIFGIFVVLAYYIFENKMRLMITEMMDKVDEIVTANLDALKVGAPGGGI